MSVRAPSTTPATGTPALTAAASAAPAAAPPSPERRLFDQRVTAWMNEGFGIANEVIRHMHADNVPPEKIQQLMALISQAAPCVQSPTPANMLPLSRTLRTMLDQVIQELERTLNTSRPAIAASGESTPAQRPPATRPTANSASSTAAQPSSDVTAAATPSTTPRAGSNARTTPSKTSRSTSRPTSATATRARSTSSARTAPSKTSGSTSRPGPAVGKNANAKTHRYRF